MTEKLNACGLSGKKFVSGDLYIEETVPANGESEEYVRLVAVEHTGMTDEEVAAGLQSGTVKRFEEESPVEEPVA